MIRVAVGVEAKGPCPYVHRGYMLAQPEELQLEDEVGSGGDIGDKIYMGSRYLEYSSIWNFDSYINTRVINRIYYPR